MPKAKDRTISQRLTWMNMLVCGVALVLACSSFIAYDLFTFRMARVRSLSTQAQILASNTISAVIFDDPDSAAKSLAALKADPHILSAAIYDAHGRPFANYVRDASEPIPSLPTLPGGQAEAHWIGQHQIELVRWMFLDGKPTGIVYIRSDVDALFQRLILYLGIASVVLLVSLLAALAVSALFQKAVATPIIQLAEVARAVSLNRTYSLRVPALQGHGEVSVLIDSFNQMMTQIEKGKASLEKAHNELELRVEERTAELVAAQKKVEAYSESILRAKEDVERASRFKDQFLSTMSHELRTPLNAVLGFSELLADARYGPLTEKQARYVSHIHTSGQHLLRLINDILDLSKIEAGRLQLSIEDVAVDASFAEVCESLHPLAEKNEHQLIQNAPRGLIVRADATRFRQMLMNLLGNAIKFTPKGGRIELAAKTIGDSIRVEVRDSGPGIPPEEKKRIFEAFHRMDQTEKTSEGTGLGLAITRKLVELHGGTLDVESRVGVGSCFFFTLPGICCDERAREDRSASIEAMPNSLAKVLVVEDDPSAAYLLESQLASVGYQVSVCREPQRAVDMAAELQPAVITLDVVMLPLNGWDVLSRLKSDPRTTHLRVVMVTVMDQRNTGLLLGADEYIVKPVDKSVLLAAVERCLNHTNATLDSSRSILVVEDDTPTREFLVELLSNQGYSVASAPDGIHARVRVQTHPPHLVILDLNLPEVSGFGLIAEWRKNTATATLPIIVLTNKDLTKDERDYLRTNTDALLSKHDPWREQLLRHVRQAGPALAEIR
jgi:signal transduction histidine kinase/DNA-binding response OmpR family regulator